MMETIDTLKNMTGAQFFTAALALAMIFGLIVVPGALIMSKDVPEEDFKKDVRKGM